MPDVHSGIGATVGSVIATKQAIIPAAVGVDIGCGMNAVRLTLTAGDLPDTPGAAAQRDRGRGAGGLRPARGEQGARQRARAHCTPAVRSAGPDRRQASGRDEDAAQVRADLDLPARHAGRWQSLHRGVPGPGPARLGDAALRLARARQRAGPLFHRRRAQGHAAPPASICRTRTSPTSARAPTCSTTTSRRCNGGRTTRGSTGAR